MNYLGDFSTGQDVFIWFNTFSSDDPAASVTMTTFIDTDVHIHKDDSLVQRNDAAGVEVDVDVDGIAGVHKLTIHTDDNTVADFYEAGHDYAVRIEGATVDLALINPVVGTFSIGNRRVAGEMCRSSIEGLTSQTQFTLTATEASAQDNAYVNCTIIVTDQTTRIQKALGRISAYTGSTREITLAAAPLATGFTMAIGDSVEILATAAFANLDAIIGGLVPTPAVTGVPDVNVTHQGDGAIPGPAVTGVPDVNLTHHVDVLASVTNSELDVNVGQIIGTVPSLTTGDIDVNVATQDAGSIATGVIAAGALTEIEDAVLDADMTSHVAQGTLGQAIGDPVADTTSIYQAVATDATGDNVAVDVVALKAETVNILADTDELQLDNVPGLIAAVQSDTDDLQTQIGVAGLGLSAIPWNGAVWDAEVESEVNDALDTVLSEIVQGVPDATPTLRDAIMLMYMALRNQVDVTTSGSDFLEIHNDAGTMVSRKALTDSGGDYSEAKMVTGV